MNWHQTWRGADVPDSRSQQRRRLITHIICSSWNPETLLIPLHWVRGTSSLHSALTHPSTPTHSVWFCVFNHILVPSFTNLCNLNKVVWLCASVSTMKSCNNNSGLYNIQMFKCLEYSKYSINVIIVIAVVELLLLLPEIFSFSKVKARSLGGLCVCIVVVVLLISSS
jgi:hypothetical protein